MKKDIDLLIASDAVLQSIVEIYGYPEPQFREQGFAAMAYIILEQQVSIVSAKATYARLAEALEGVTPESATAASDEIFRSAGVSRQKTAYIKDMAMKVLAGELDFTSFPSKTESEIREELLRIKGVGNWSIEVYLMFCLQSEDIIPLGDIAIVNTMKEFWPGISKDEMVIISERWKPYRTAAAYVLWHHYLRKRGR